MNNAIATFTSNTLEDILAHGGDYSWHLDPDRAKRCQFLLCVSSIGSSRRTGFLIGKVSEIVRDEKIYQESGETRYQVKISDMANVNIPNIDFKFRNPVKYCQIEAFNIDPSKLEFKPVVKQRQVEIQPMSLSILEAKTALALHYGINQECITITINA
jgi:hypothetical protein